MNKQEYYNRLNKITSKISTDRVYKDEEYNLICQKNYLATKYIESLEQENKELHNKIDKAIEYINKNSIYFATSEKVGNYFSNCNCDDLLEILKESDVDGK